MSHPANADDQVGRWLFVLTLIAYGTSLICLLWAGPERPIHPDELNFLYESLRLPAEQRLSGYNHAALLFELVAFAESAWYLVLRGSGQVASPGEFLTDVLVNQPVHLALVRAIVGTAGLLLLIQVHRLGVLFGGRLVGALACLLTATNLTFGLLAWSGKEDVLYLLLSVTAMLWIWKVIQRNTVWPAVVAGLSIGAGIAAKYFGVFALALSAVPFLHAEPAGRTRALRQGIVTMVVAGVSVLIFMPFLLTDTGSVVKSISQLNSVTGLFAGGVAFPQYVFVHLPNLVGWVVLTAGTFELAWRARRDRRGPWLLGLPSVLLLVFLGLRPGFNRAHYIYPVALFLFILASSFAVRCYRWAGTSGWRWLSPAAVIMVAGSSAVYLPGLIKYALILTGPDTRMLARDYIHAHVPPGECVVLTHGVVGWNVFGPPLSPSNPPAGSGAFWTANRAALERVGGPRYQLKIVDGVSGFPPDLTAGCDWIVSPRTSDAASRELGPHGVDRDKPPRGFEVAGVIRGFPEPQTTTWPFLAPEDYRELRTVSFRQLWTERARGFTLVVYRRSDSSRSAVPGPRSSGDRIARDRIG